MQANKAMRKTDNRHGNFLSEITVMTHKKANLPACNHSL